MQMRVSKHIWPYRLLMGFFCCFCFFCFMFHCPDGHFLLGLLPFFHGWIHSYTCTEPMIKMQRQRAEVADTMEAGIKWEQNTKGKCHTGAVGLGGGGRIPGLRRKQSSQHSVGIHCTAVSSCRPIRHRELQYCKVWREREEEGRRGEEWRGRGVPHCRYESKWRRQEERRIIAVALQCHSTLHGRNYRTTRTSERERERERGGGGDRNPRQTTEFSWLDFFCVVLSSLNFWNCTHFASSSQKRQLERAANQRCASASSSSSSVRTP